VLRVSFAVLLALAGARLLRDALVPTEVIE
jgi:hypothetical protein